MHLLIYLFAAFLHTLQMYSFVILIFYIGTLRTRVFKDPLANIDVHGCLSTLTRLLLIYFS